MNFRNNEAALIKNAQSISILDLRVKALEKRISRVGISSSSISQDISKEIAEIRESIDSVIESIGTSQNDDKTIFNALNTIYENVKDIGDLDTIVEDLGNIKTELNSNIYNLYDSIYEIYGATNNLITITTTLQGEVDKVFNAVDTLELYSGKIYNAVDTLEAGQENILKAIDDKTADLTSAISKITTDNTTNTTMITGAVSTSTTTITTAVNSVYDRIYDLFDVQNVEIDKIYNAVDSLEAGQENIQETLTTIDTVGDDTNRLVKELHYQMNPSPVLSFTAIFTATESSAYNKDYIPPPGQPEQSEETGENLPYYIIGNDGFCEFHNVEINDMNANYNQRVDTLRNICKVYRKYKFISCVFNNVDLSRLFADNIILESFPEFSNCVFSGEINLRELFRNCTNLSNISGFKDMITSVDNKGAANPITSLIMDDMFTGCAQFSEIGTEGINLASCFERSKIATISMENMFSCVLTIGGILNFTSMFLGSAIKSINVKNMFSNLKVITSNEICVRARGMFYECKQLNDIDLSNMFPVLSRMSPGTDFDAVFIPEMFEKCENLKVINMNIFMKNLICLTTTENNGILYNNMLTGILTESNNKLTFSYSDFIFSNALGYTKNNIPFDFQDNIKITPTDGGPAGFPYYYEHTDTQDIKNHYNQYDAQARKIITWERVSNTEYKQSTIIIKRY